MFRKKIPKKMSRSAEKNEAPTKKCPLSPHCYLTKKTNHCNSRAHFYTCDKHVLWESAGDFFSRDNSFQPATRTVQAFVAVLIV